MGSGARQDDLWVTPDAYSRLFSGLSPATHTATADTNTEVVNAFGWMSRDGRVELSPWYRFAAPVPEPVTGTYTIEAVDVFSKTLSSQGFDVSFVVLTNPPREVDPAPFEVTVAIPAGTQAFRIKRDEQVLKVVPISPNRPTINITTPTAGQNISGLYTITWQSNDLDGSPLYHTVEYSHNGRDWLVLAAKITTTQLLANFDALPGGGQSRIRVIVTDGINTAEAVSDAFVVTPKPPTVFIESPSTGARYRWETTISLVGSAYDPQDGWLHADEALEWRSDRDGVLGRGEMLNLSDLSVGQHTITLSAADSLNLTTTTSVRINVGETIYLPLTLRNAR